ncbi:MAG: dihydrolipoyl dehydrogenase [Deltaproteobacteria bacterium]|nr:dihydrolipoyl dehydrogenase [Deltaproteobacteria bacterium]
MKEIDLFIIGSGPGGYTAAIRAAQLGAKVAIIEKDELGGTCLNKGCIPTKSLIASTWILNYVKEAGDFGINVKEKGVNFDAVMRRKERVLGQMRRGIRYLLKSYDIEVIKGDAYFISPFKIKVGDKLFDIKKCIIATGSIPSEISGIRVDGERIMTSDHILQIRHIPSSLLIIGAGAIGLEFACIFHALGTKVTIVELLPYILPGEDMEVSQTMKKILMDSGIDIKTNTTIEEINCKDIGIEVTFKSTRGIDKIIAERVLIAIGRRPYTRGLGLKNARIIHENNKIIVNHKMETNIKGIYAIGDVTGPPFLANKALAEGVVAAENAMDKQATVDYKAIPRCIFTLPEVASVGLSEEMAIKSGHKIKVGRFPLIASGRAITIGKTKGFIKIIVDRETDTILGVHIVSAYATELIAEAALAIKLGCTTKELTRIIHPHPTFSEAIFQASLDAHKRATDLPKNV